MHVHRISVTAFSWDQFILRLNFPGTRLLWECHEQSQETNLTWLHHCSWIAFLSQKKQYTKNRSVCKKCRDLVWELHFPTHRLLHNCIYFQSALGLKINSNITKWLKQTQQVKNFNWQEADQLAVDMCGVEPGTSKDNQAGGQSKTWTRYHGLLNPMLKPLSHTAP